MPKNPNLNIARYKVAGGELNEFEFSQNQQAFVEQQQHDADNLIPGTPPEMKSEESSERRGALGASTAKASVRLPPKTRRTASKKTAVKRAVSQKGREKSAKKPAKPTKSAKRSAASKRRPAKKAAKRSTKKAARKTGTKKK